MFKNELEDRMREGMWTNLSDIQEEGLMKLDTRKKKEKDVIFLTDKSEKMGICSREDYVKMGSVHTSKDTLITFQELAKMAEELNNHTFTYPIFIVSCPS